MRLVSKNEQILYVYFVAQKKKTMFLFYIYNFYFLVKRMCQIFVIYLKLFFFCLPLLPLFF